MSLESFLFREYGSTLFRLVLNKNVADSAVSPIPRVWEELDKGLLYPRKPKQLSLSLTYSWFQRTRSRFAPYGSSQLVPRFEVHFFLLEVLKFVGVQLVQ